MLFEQSEFALYTIEQELRAARPDLKCEFLIGDVRDEARLNEIMNKYHPAVVFMRRPTNMCADGAAQCLASGAHNVLAPAV